MYMLSRMSCAKMIDQLKDLRQRVDETNKRKKMKHIKSQSGEIDDDEVMDRLSVKWAKKPDSLTELLDRLEAAYDFLGIDGINDQYKALQDYADEHGSVKFVTKDTFKRWMDPHTRGSRKVKKNPAWDIIRDFVDHNQNSEEITDEVNMPVKSSNDVDKFKMIVPELPSMQVPDVFLE
eukprot:scaffold33692_cov23-Cyclotella_meneghiniana.AAC.2